MTIECDGVINAKKQIENLNPRKLDGLRAAHSPGDYVRIVVSDEYEGLHEMAFKKFHAMRDELADSMPTPNIVAVSSIHSQPL